MSLVICKIQCTEQQQWGPVINTINKIFCIFLVCMCVGGGRRYRSTSSIHNSLSMLRVENPLQTLTAGYISIGLIRFELTVLGISSYLIQKYFLARKYFHHNCDIKIIVQLKIILGEIKRKYNQSKTNDNTLASPQTMHTLTNKVSSGFIYLMSSAILLYRYRKIQYWFIIWITKERFPESLHTDLRIFKCNLHQIFTYSDRGDSPLSTHI